MSSPVRFRLGQRLLGPGHMLQAIWTHEENGVEAGHLCAITNVAETGPNLFELELWDLNQKKRVVVTINLKGLLGFTYAGELSHQTARWAADKAASQRPNQDTATDPSGART